LRRADATLDRRADPGSHGPGNLVRGGRARRVIASAPRRVPDAGDSWSPLSGAAQLAQIMCRTHHGGVFGGTGTLDHDGAAPGRIACSARPSSRTWAAPVSGPVWVTKAASATDKASMTACLHPRGLSPSKNRH